MGRITTRRRIVKLRVGDPEAQADGTSSPALANPGWSAPFPPATAPSAVDAHERVDILVVEEPLELRVGGAPITITMRTPGHDIELVHGFLATEGVIAERADVALARYCEGAVVNDADGHARNTYNVLDLTLAPDVPPPAVDITRNFYTTSSCGVCGKASIDALRTQQRYDLTEDRQEVNAAVIAALPKKLRAAQSAFEQTGGLHAAGLFTARGDVLCVREDVGRHNAVDKVIGWALLEGRLPLRGAILMVSGRASFELTQKAAMAGIPVMAAVSAPSSLAVEVADELGMTLAAFVRGDTMNVYAGADRIAS